MSYQFTYPHPNQLIVQKGTANFISGLVLRIVGLLFFALIFSSILIAIDLGPLFVRGIAIVFMLAMLGREIYAEFQTRYPLSIDGAMKTVSYNEKKLDFVAGINRVVIEQYRTGGRNRQTRYRLKVGTADSLTNTLAPFFRHEDALFVADEIAEVLGVEVHSIRPRSIFSV